MHQPFSSPVSRRTLMAGTLALGGALLAGPSALFAKPAPTKMTMHRGPGCGCCVKWAEIARQSGYAVDIVDDPELMAFKDKAGVPQSLRACHTTIAGAYVIEGHVPFDAVKKLLAQKPKIRGIAVAGMPMGSPGMEMHGHDHAGHSAEPIQVYAFDAAGKVSFFG